MNERYNFFLDVLNILPNPIECYIQAPSLDDNFILSQFEDTEYPYYKLFKFNNQTTDEFIKRVINNNVLHYFQSMEIRQKNNLLFKGYDGIEFGEISKNINVPS